MGDENVLIVSKGSISMETCERMCSCEFAWLELVRRELIQASSKAWVIAFFFFFDIKAWVIAGSTVQSKARKVIHASLHRIREAAP